MSENNTVNTEKRTINSFAKEAPLIYYGCGTYLECMIPILYANDIDPVCIVDKSPEKQNKKFHLAGKNDILSPEEAFKKYPNAYVLITMGEQSWDEITEELVSAGFTTKDRIINHRCTKQGCVKMLHCCDIENDVIMTCTKNRAWNDEWTRPPIQINSNNYDETVALYNSEAEEILKNSAYKTTKFICADCQNYAKIFIYDKHKADHFTYAEGGKCQLKCIYCNHEIQSFLERKIDGSGLIKLLEAFRSADSIGRRAKIQTSGGEPTISDYLSPLLEKIKEWDYTVRFTTNAVKFDERVVEMLELDAANEVLTTLDAGTPGTFKKVKGADCFYQVRENLKKYSEANPYGVIVKYIAMPGINTSEEELNAFAETIAYIKPRWVWISANELDRKPMPEEDVERLHNLYRKLAYDMNYGKHVFIESMRFHDKKQAWRIGEESWNLEKLK